MNDYHGNTPYTHFKEHKVKYAKGYRGHAQKNIGMRPAKGNKGPNYSREASPRNQKYGNGNSKNSGHKNSGGHGKKK
jgi:hypothetical protein